MDDGSREKENHGPARDVLVLVQCNAMRGNERMDRTNQPKERLSAVSVMVWRKACLD